MALSSGSRIGPYAIIDRLGAGGMGEVYRATDTTLDRQVAIKILPSAFASDHDRVARFEREAKTLASLNHPHIAAIYGFEKTAGAHALIMELVDGEDLSAHISRGPMSLADALPIAKQIAEALEGAHEQGIIHRDLKPANVKVRADGTVKVLDFGLAKAMAPGDTSAAANAMNSPTLTSHGTQMGMILGTAAYMAPEQASGKSVDKRADIWAFGVVLWEMLTGKRMFEGETVSHVLAAVLTSEPDLAAVPPRVRHLLSRCLQKDPRNRLRDIGDAMSLVRGPEAAARGDEAAAPVLTPSKRWLTSGGWTVAGVMAAVLAGVMWWRPATTSDAGPAVVRFQIERAADIYNATATTFAVSPDGRLLAYYGAAGTRQRALLVHTLATSQLIEVPGTESAIFPPDSLFWSPDSRQLVYGTTRSAHVFDVATVTTRPLCDCRFTGGTWNRDGVILLGSFTNARDGIRRLSTNDRTPVAVTTVDATRDERDTFPVFLPDGRRFLFTRSTPGSGVSTYVGTLDGDAPTRIGEGSRRAFVPAAEGRRPYLLAVDTAGLAAQAFDLDAMRVTGASVTVVPGAVSVSVSENGVLASSALGIRPRTIPTWFDRKGSSLGHVGEMGFLESLALSPDGQKLAVGDNPSGLGDIWLRDIRGGAGTRVTFSPGADSTPVWSPDGSRIAFSTRREGVNLPYVRAADGTGDETPLFPWERAAFVNDWSADGRWVIFSTLKTGSTIDNDLWVVPMAGTSNGTPAPYLDSKAKQQQAQFSPDGRFVAYGSDESGTWEIYVQPFPNAAEGKWMISAGGGAEPRWSRDGTELFYFSRQTLIAVPVGIRPTFSHGAPKALFDAAVQGGYTNDSHRWQVARDGKRFLLLTNAGNDQAPPLTVIVNWPQLLKE